MFDSRVLKITCIYFDVIKYCVYFAHFFSIDLVHVSWSREYLIFDFLQADTFDQNSRTTKRKGFLGL